MNSETPRTDALSTQECTRVNQVPRKPAYEFIAARGPNIYSQIKFSSGRDAIAYYNANAVGLTPNDQIRMQLFRKGRLWKDTARSPT